MSDIIDILKDIHHQATTEQSHYYTGNAINMAINEINHQRELVKVLCTKVSLYNLHKGRWMTKNEMLAWAESQIKARVGEGK